MKIIAHIQTDFDTKFGIPRQSGLVEGLKGRIIFEPEYRHVETLRGLEGFSHIWLLWHFSEAKGQWSPTVRPPMLGGNKRMGVWATRSPFRPNNIGLSSVRLTAIHLQTSDGPVLEVEGADLLNGTPILDIKPYLPFTDSHPDARGGFAQEIQETCQPLEVLFPPQMSKTWSEKQLQTLRQILAADPRPHYHADPERTYAMNFAGREIRFQVKADQVLVLE